jgi:hypothetical protein
MCGNFKQDVWKVSSPSELMGFWTVSIIWDSKKLETTTFRKLDLFPSSGKGGERDTYSVGSLRKS